MNDIILKLHEFGRDYLPYGFLMTIGGVASLLGIFFWVASFYSILRIRFAIKREGLTPPELHLFNIYNHWNLFTMSPSKADKLLKSGATFFNYISGDIKHVPRHIKPIDRFVTMGFFILLPVGLIFVYAGMWLYPEYGG